MELLQKYFLSVARHPIWYVFRTVVLIYVLALFGLKVYSELDPPGTNGAVINQIIFYLSVSSVVIFIAVAYINEKVVSAKITIAKLEPNEMGLMLFMGNVTGIYKKPVWGKHLINIVTFPEKWDWRTEKGDKKDVLVGIKVKIDKKVSALVPIKIKFTFSGPFQIDELRQILQIDDSSCLNKTSMNIKELVSQKFREFNNGLSHDLIQADLYTYLNSEVSMQTLTYSIMKRISFPKNLFTNVEKTEIEVLKPKFRFAKEA